MPQSNLVHDVYVGMEVSIYHYAPAVKSPMLPAHQCHQRHGHHQPETSLSTSPKPRFVVGEKNGIRDACSTADIYIYTVLCYPLLFIVVHCCPSLSIVIHFCQLLSIIVHCCSLLSIVVNCCPLLSIIVHTATGFNASVYTDLSTSSKNIIVDFLHNLN